MQTQISTTTCLYVYAESTNPAVFRNLFGALIHLDLLSIHLNILGNQKVFITPHFVSYPGQTAFLLTGSPVMESPFIPCGPDGPWGPGGPESPRAPGGPWKQHKKKKIVYFSKKLHKIGVKSLVITSDETIVFSNMIASRSVGLYSPSSPARVICLSFWKWYMQSYVLSKIALWIKAI